AGRGGALLAFADQSFGFGRASVIDGQRMTRGEQMSRHAASHASNADEAGLPRLCASCDSVTVSERSSSGLDQIFRLELVERSRLRPTPFAPLGPVCGIA